MYVAKNRNIFTSTTPSVEKRNQTALYSEIHAQIMKRPKLVIKYFKVWSK